MNPKQTRLCWLTCCRPLVILLHIDLKPTTIADAKWYITYIPVCVRADRNLMLEPQMHHGDSRASCQRQQSWLLGTQKQVRMKANLQGVHGLEEEYEDLMLGFQSQASTSYPRNRQVGVTSSTTDHYDVVNMCSPQNPSSPHLSTLAPTHAVHCTHQLNMKHSVVQGQKSTEGATSNRQKRSKQVILQKGATKCKTPGQAPHLNTQQGPPGGLPCQYINPPCRTFV